VNVELPLDPPTSKCAWTKRNVDWVHFVSNQVVDLSMENVHPLSTPDAPERLLLSVAVIMLYTLLLVKQYRRVSISTLTSMPVDLDQREAEDR
jgi:hypothetical protein